MKKVQPFSEKSDLKCLDSEDIVLKGPKAVSSDNDQKSLENDFARTHALTHTHGHTNKQRKTHIHIVSNMDIQRETH